MTPGQVSMLGWRHGGGAGGRGECACLYFSEFADFLSEDWEVAGKRFWNVKQQPLDEDCDPAAESEKEANGYRQTFQAPYFLPLAIGAVLSVNVLNVKVPEVPPVFVVIEGKKFTSVIRIVPFSFILHERMMIR